MAELIDNNPPQKILHKKFMVEDLIRQDYLCACTFCYSYIFVNLFWFVSSDMKTIKLHSFAVISSLKKGH